MHSTLAVVNLSHLIAAYWGGPAEALGHLIGQIASYWGGAAE